MAEKRIQYRKDTDGSLVEQRIGSAADIVTYVDTDDKLGLTNTELNVQKAIEKVVDLANSGGEALSEIINEDDPTKVNKAVIADTATTATTANKVANKLTIIVSENGATTTKTFDGSSVVTVNTVKSAECDADGNVISTTYAKSSDFSKYIPSSEKGAKSGVATLDSNGVIPSTQLPSYVDDIIEGSLTDSVTFVPDTDDSVVKQTGKIYVDTGTGKTYRWSGSQYTEISKSITTGTNEGQAYPGPSGLTNATNIGILQGQVATAQSNISTLQSNVSTLQTNYNTLSDTVEEHNDEIANIISGTTTVEKAANATTATSAGKLSAAKTIELTGDISGSVSTDFSGKTTIETELPDTDVTPGTWCAVTVDAKGRVTAGNHILEWGTKNQTTPSNTTAVGGLFMKLVD